MKNEADVLEFFKVHRAFWEHGGDPRQPHVLATHGDHLGVYVNWTPIVENPVLLGSVCRELVKKMVGREGLHCHGRVVGPAHGANFLVYEMARALTLQTGFSWLAGFSEPQPDKSTLLKRFDVVDQPVLVIDDTLTTREGSIAKTVAEVKKNGGRVLPFVVALFNRSGLTHIGEREIVALISRQLPAYQAGSCPLCALGSKAIPAAKGNWKLLHEGW